MNDLMLTGTVQGIRPGPPRHPANMALVPRTMPGIPALVRNMGNVTPMPRALPGYEPELPARLNISAKAALGIMLVAVVNLIPVLAPALMRNP